MGFVLEFVEKDLAMREVPCDKSHREVTSGAVPSASGGGGSIGGDDQAQGSSGMCLAYFSDGEVWRTFPCAYTAAAELLGSMTGDWLTG